MVVILHSIPLLWYVKAFVVVVVVNKAGRPFSSHTKRTSGGHQTRERERENSLQCPTVAVFELNNRKIEVMFGRYVQIATYKLYDIAFLTGLIQNELTALKEGYI